jgi:hypothetical protein
MKFIFSPLVWMIRFVVIVALVFPTGYQGKVFLQYLVFFANIQYKTSSGAISISDAHCLISKLHSVLLLSPFKKNSVLLL